MIAIDTQILVYAHRADSPWHARARDRIAHLANTGIRWAIPMHCLVELYAKVTHPRLFKPPTPSELALAQIDIWLESPTVTLLTEDARTWSITRDLLGAARIAGDQAYDARIAAVCLQHGVTELWTSDRKFINYPALRVLNPLVDIHPTHAGERRATYQPRPASSPTRTPRKPKPSKSRAR